MSTPSLRKIEVLGPGCTRCKETFPFVQHVVEAETLPFEVEKVESMERPQTPRHGSSLRLRSPYPDGYVVTER